MRRFQLEELVDYVRGVADPDLRSRIDLAAREPGSETATDLAWIREVQDLLETDARLSPPPELTRSVLSFPRITGRHTAAPAPLLPVELIASPTAAATDAPGMRAQAPESRDLLAHGDGYELDLHLESASETAALYIVGRLSVDGRRPDELSDLPVVLLGYGRIVGSTLTNRLGDFYVEAASYEVVELCVLVPELGQIRVPLMADEAPPLSPYTH